jgi:hypothetical protein
MKCVPCHARHVALTHCKSGLVETKLHCGRECFVSNMENTSRHNNGPTVQLLSNLQRRSKQTRVVQLRLCVERESMPANVATQYCSAEVCHGAANVILSARKR